LIFEKEIYASACLVGGITYLTLDFLGLKEEINFIFAASIIFTIRLIAVKFHLQLPKIKDDLFTKK
jgi:uncharacterized membrane protein YeiH